LAFIPHHMEMAIMPWLSLLEFHNSTSSINGYAAMSLSNLYQKSANCFPFRFMGTDNRNHNDAHNNSKHQYGTVTLFNHFDGRIQCFYWYADDVNLNWDQTWYDKIIWCSAPKLLSSSLTTRLNPVKMLENFSTW